MKKITNNKGFTFIELILYMAILGIFMVAVITLVASTVNTNRKQKSIQKLQTQATETYDTISGMLMGATEVKIVGAGYVGSGVTYSRTIPEATKIEDAATADLSCFMVPGETDTKASNLKLCSGNSTSPVYKEVVTGSSGSEVSVKINNCYDLTDVKPFDEKSSVNDTESLIDTRYLWIEYASDYVKDSAGKIVKDSSNNIIYNVHAFCTITFDEKNHKLYIYRDEVSESDYAKWKLEAKSDDPGVANPALAELRKTEIIKDGSSENGTLLAKNVENFQLQVNPDDNSVALLISFKDNKTSETYDITGIVGLRNSFVLKKHEWN